MTLDIFLWFGIAVGVVPVLVFCLQVIVASLLHRREIGVDCPVENWAPHTVILMPAHNEAKVIGDTLSQLQSLRPEMRVLVVADNCSDDTALIARAKGVEVIERSAADLRGKGYALQYGLEHLRARAPSVVIVLDADCNASPADMQRLAQACANSAKPVQGVYLMHAPLGGGVGNKIAEFAWLVKTMVRPRGWHFLGGTCQLMGSGFALPWHIAQTLNLASGHLVEDMKLTMDLAKLRKAPVFVESVRISSVFPTAVSAQVSQRRRWEHGHLGMVLTEVPLALLRAAITLNPQLLSVAADLLVPPLSLLVLLFAGLSVSALVQTVVGGLTYSSILVWVLSAALCSAVLLAWSKWGRSVLTARELMAVPAFVWQKLGVYGGFLWRRERQWKRTDRD